MACVTRRLNLCLVTVVVILCDMSRLASEKCYWYENGAAYVCMYCCNDDVLVGYIAFKPMRTWYEKA